MKVTKMMVLKQNFIFPPQIYVLGASEKKSWKNFQKWASYVNFKYHEFLAEFSFGDFWVESFFCTKSSIKWAKLDQFTIKMAQMKAYTSVLNVKKLKLCQTAIKHFKKGSYCKKISQKLSEFLSLDDLKGLFRGLIPVHLTQKWS